MLIRESVSTLANRICGPNDRVHLTKERSTHPLLLSFFSLNGFTIHHLRSNDATGLRDDFHVYYQ